MTEAIEKQIREKLLAAMLSDNISSDVVIEEDTDIPPIEDK
jgi:hypothetical protein